MSWKDRLQAACTSLGVQVVTREPNPLPSDWSPNPFDNKGGGLSYTHRIIHVHPDVCADSFIHEVGHVVADPYPPGEGEETPWLWWEAAVAYWLDAVKEWQNRNSYGINGELLLGDTLWRKLDFFEIEDIPLRVLRSYARAAHRYGISIGMFDSNGAPIKFAERKAGPNT